MTDEIEGSMKYPYDTYPDADYLAHSGSPLADKPLVLIREALFFNEETYGLLRDHAAPMRRGAFLLLMIVVAVAVAQAIGLALGLLTSPRINILQDAVYDFITQMNWFVNRAAASPEFGRQFSQAYEGLWQSIRLLTGYPSWSGTLAAAVTAIGGAYLNWLIYGVLTHWTARWFGGKASLAQFLGPLALSYAPLLLTVILMVPGGAIAMPLVFLALFVAKYQAVKTTYDLHPAGSLAVTVMPYLLTALLLATLVIFGLAYGAGRIPFIDPIMRIFRLLSLF